MAIQNRHGTYPYFDPGKMVTGEFAVVTGGDPHTSTGKAVYICYAPGDCQRFATNEEISAAISDAIEQSGEFQDVVETTVTEVLEDHPEWTTTIQDGAVTTAKIADGAVTTAKIADGAVTPGKLDNNFVTSLTENTTGDDTDLLMVGNQGTSVLRKFTLANLATYLINKLTGSVQTATAENTYCSATYSYITFGPIVFCKVTFTPKTTISQSTGSLDLANLPKGASLTAVSPTYLSTSAASILGVAVLVSKGFAAYGARESGKEYVASFVYI